MEENEYTNGYQSEKAEDSVPAGKIVKVILLGIVAVLVLGCVIAVLLLSRNDKIYKNVSAAGISLGGMTQNQAEKALNARGEELYGDYTLTLNFPDRSVTLGEDVLGITYDAAAVAEEAFEIGREGGSVHNARSYLKSGKAEPVSLEMPINVDEAAIRQELQKLLPEVTTQAEESKVHVDMEAEYIDVTIGEPGQTLDVSDCCSKILAAVRQGQEKELSLDYSRTLSSAVDLSKVYGQVHRDMSDAYYDEKTGKLVEEKIGYGFDLAAANQQLRMAKGGETIRIKMETEYPSVTMEDLQGVYFSDVIGSCTTYGLGGSNRSTNIIRACETINGVVVKPGETFSYNQTLGERTEEKGYKFAGAYVNGKSVAEVGGGICQVSSTLYNCVLQANLEIVTRSEHVYSAGYVDLGMDATVSWGGPDFQFRNNSENPIRIEAWVENGGVFVRLMGTPTGVTVKMTYQVLSTTPYTTVIVEDEKDVNDIGRDGRTVVTYRNVYDAESGALISSEVEDYSYYQRSDIAVLKKDFDEEVEKRRKEEEEKKKEEEEKEKEEEKKKQEATAKPVKNA